jgi:hypothetical protein
LKQQPLINLNVGGYKFTLSKKILLKEEKSFFVKMLKGKVPIVKDENGNYFIDRNGSLFEYVVEFLYNKKFFI